MMRIALLCSLTLVALALVACGDGNGTGDRPDEQAGEDGLIRGQAPEQFYMASCASCHGSERGGGMGPPLRPADLDDDDDYYAAIIREGVSGTPMPAWERQLSDLQVDLLVEFLRSEP